MLSSLLRSKRAMKVNVEIMRAFVRLILSEHRDLARKLDAMEKAFADQSEKMATETVLLNE